jgi:hypothetical protein
MMRDFEVARGDICGDPSGLRVIIEDGDSYDYVHFSVIQADLESGEGEVELRQMSHVAFVHRFS